MPGERERLPVTRASHSHPRARRLKLFKWHQHADGKLHCVQGIVQDVNMHPGSAGSLESLGPDIVSGLFKEAQLRKRPDEVVRLAETLTRGGVKLDRFQLVGVIFAHLSLNEAVKAFSVLVEMYENKLSPPERTVEGIAEELAKHSASVDESYYLLESRKAAGGEVPLPAVNIVIEACAMMGDLDRAFATWAELEQLALQPNTGTFNALLHTCVRTREIASGRRLLSRMAQDGVKPDSKTFMHQASLHVMAREESLALDVLKQCKEANCVPTGKMYVGLINMMIRGRKGNAAKVRHRQFMHTFKPPEHMAPPFIPPCDLPFAGAAGGDADAPQCEQSVDTKGRGRVELSMHKGVCDVEMRVGRYVGHIQARTRSTHGRLDRRHPLLMVAVGTRVWTRCTIPSWDACVWPYATVGPSHFVAVVWSRGFCSVAVSSGVAWRPRGAAQVRSVRRAGVRVPSVICDFVCACGRRGAVTGAVRAGGGARPNRSPVTSRVPAGVAATSSSTPHRPPAGPRRTVDIDRGYVPFQSREKRGHWCRGCRVFWFTRSR